MGDNNELRIIGQTLDKPVEADPFASSRGASTSSNKQKGLGLIRNMAKIREIAVSAFSPPERRFRF